MTKTTSSSRAEKGAFDEPSPSTEHSQPPPAGFGRPRISDEEALPTLPASSFTSTSSSPIGRVPRSPRRVHSLQVSAPMARCRTSRSSLSVTTSQATTVVPPSAASSSSASGASTSTMSSWKAGESSTEPGSPAMRARASMVCFAWKSRALSSSRTISLSEVQWDQGMPSTRTLYSTSVFSGTSRASTCRVTLGISP